MKRQAKPANLDSAPKRNRRDQAVQKKAGARGKPNKGNFKPQDPRINYEGRPPGVLALREMMRETGEQTALNTLLEAMKARGLNLGTAVRASNTWLTYANPELTTAPTVIKHEGSVRVNLSHLTDQELDEYERLATKARERTEPGELPSGEDAPESPAEP